MSEKNLFFQPGSELSNFNIFFDFPEEIRPKVMEKLKILASANIDPNQEMLEDPDIYQRMAYDFARAIDPSFKEWHERSSGYKTNQQTNSLLIKFYDMIKNRNSKQFTNAVEQLLVEVT